MIDPSISEWLPDDLELKNFYIGVDEFVKRDFHFIDFSFGIR